MIIALWVLHQLNGQPAPCSPGFKIDLGPVLKLTGILTNLYDVQINSIGSENIVVLDRRQVEDVGLYGPILRSSILPSILK